ncbi:hypothetical protein A6R74_21575 [Halomonas sp. ALS9]|nr:hypothetical protein A6R74_21575 [Halomonas sp. ALS9]
MEIIQCRLIHFESSVHVAKLPLSLWERQFIALCAIVMIVNLRQMSLQNFCRRSPSWITPLEPPMCFIVMFDTL